VTRSWCRPDHARNRRIGSLLNAGLVGAALLGLVTGRGHSDVLTPLDRDAEATRVTQRRGITRARRSSEDPVRIHGQDLAVDRSRLVKTVSIKEEWYQDVDDPEAFVEALKVSRLNADLFTFWQRPTDPRPKYAYYREPDAVAVIPIKGYRYWLEHQLNKRTRQAIRKAQRRGVDVRTVTFDDQLVGEITAIYNETPIRQGKRFPHYGKGFEAVKKINESYQERSEFLGAYYKDELIGFMKLTYMENYVDTMQLLSKIAHRDKSPSNALLAKAVCAGPLIAGIVQVGARRYYQCYAGRTFLFEPSLTLPLVACHGQVGVCRYLNHHAGISAFHEPPLACPFVAFRQRSSSRPSSRPSARRPARSSATC